MNPKLTHEELNELFDNEEQEKIDEIIKDQNNFEVFFEVVRERRLKRFYAELGIDEEKFEKIKNKKIKLHPESIKCPLMSTLYREHNGKYRVEDLIFEYHDSVFRDGIIIGLEYGKKFIIDDIQNNRFTKEDILNMSDNDRIAYMDENREEI